MKPLWFVVAKQQITNPKPLWRLTVTEEKTGKAALVFLDNSPVKFDTTPTHRVAAAAMLRMARDLGANAVEVVGATAADAFIAEAMAQEVARQGAANPAGGGAYTDGGC